MAVGRKVKADKLRRGRWVKATSRAPEMAVGLSSAGSLKKVRKKK